MLKVSAVNRSLLIVYIFNIKWNIGILKLYGAENLPWLYVNLRLHPYKVTNIPLCISGYRHVDMLTSAMSHTALSKENLQRVNYQLFLKDVSN